MIAFPLKPSTPSRPRIDSSVPAHANDPFAGAASPRQARLRLNLLSLFLVSLLPAMLSPLSDVSAADQPNILWISSEDHGPNIGPYGDEYASTPNLDAFATRSLRYTRASSNAPVCAPARTTIISGMFPPSLGAHHMRSRVPSPTFLRFFPTYLREAGYYTSNNSKEDYNLLTDDKGWDESSPQAHWRNRPNPNQPFFAVFNFTGTHESQIRNENENPQRDPALAPIPPYHPDTPEVRKDWAQYYDRLTLLDSFFQERLDELEAAGLAEDTIVIFWADHGSGMPRSKRYPGWSGLHVPLMVHIPEKFRHLAPEDYSPGKTSDRLVSFVDFAPTTLSLAGIRSPDHYHGAAFLGQFIAKAPSFSYGFRGRMDERPDECRSVTDGRYMYIRNYLPHVPHGQYLRYQQITPTTRVWYELFKDGKLNEVQSAFWRPHPAEELFDLKADPHETKNLAGDPSHAAALEKLRRALLKHQERTQDLYFIPEPILQRPILTGISPAQYFSPNPKWYRSVFPAPSGSKQRLPSEAARSTPPANTVTQSGDSDAPSLPSASSDVKNAYSLERSLALYWQLNDLLSAPANERQLKLPFVLEATQYPEPVVRVAAAEILARHAPTRHQRNQALDTLVDFARYPQNELFLSIHALNALDRIREDGTELPAAVAELDGAEASLPGPFSSYRSSVIERF